MRKTLPEKIERGRIVNDNWLGTRPNSGPSGAFLAIGPEGTPVRIIASAADIPESEGWEHVSVSLEHRCPNWAEMCFVKEAFWEDDEIAFQLHPAKSEWINNHPNVLHLWRKVGKDPPLPPGIFVGIKEDGEYGSKEAAEAGYQRAKARGLIK